MTPKFHSLKVREVRRETEDTVSIAFDIPADLKADYAYQSGQYLTLKAFVNGEEIRRSYSLCSAPYENEWRVAIKQVENGRFSSYATTEVKAELAMDVMTPMGNFILEPSANATKSYALFAAGSGITPVISIAKTVLEEEAGSDVTLFYGNKNFSTIIFREELEALKNRYMDRLRIVHVFSRESVGNKIQKGRIDAKKAAELYDAFLKDTAVDAVYICGPETMILGVKESLIEKGIPETSIHFELFTTPSSNAKDVAAAAAELPQVDSNVTIIVDGDEFHLHLDSSGAAILDAAHEVGADLPFACKGGVCCTCKAKIVEGTARMDVNYALEPDEVAAGFILTCQAHPTSDKLIISFDE